MLALLKNKSSYFVLKTPRKSNQKNVFREIARKLQVVILTVIFPSTYCTCWRWIINVSYWSTVFWSHDKKKLFRTRSPKSTNQNAVFIGHDVLITCFREWVQIVYSNQTDRPYWKSLNHKDWVSYLCSRIV